MTGDLDRLGQVVDVDGYRENCVGLTGWTTGLAVAIDDFRTGVGSWFSDLCATVHDVIETEDAAVMRMGRGRRQLAAAAPGG